MQSQWYRRFPRALWLLNHLISLGFIAGAFGQTEKPTEHIRLRSEAVILDVVVHDGKGQLIRDLKADDFRVFENEVRQSVRSARLVDGSQPSASPDIVRASDGLTPGQRTAGAQIHLVGLVFGGLEIESRRFAREAAEDLLKSSLPPNTYIGVFAIDKGLRALAPYTAELAKVREGADLATSGRSQEIYSRSRDLHNQVLSKVQGSGQGNGQGLSFSEKFQLVSATDSPESLKAIIENDLLLLILENARSIETEIQGLSDMEALGSIVSAQKELPGRKTIVYFSEGLYLPERFAYRLRNLTSESNRANVSIYSVDARGLISRGQTQAGSAALGRASALSRSQVQSGGVGTTASGPAAGMAQAQSATRGSGPVTPEHIRSLETAENSVRMNVQETLEDLSSSTGGVATVNTNDAASAMKRLAADLQQYYEIVYIPEADPTDLNYRRIRVEVDRDSAIVQSRDGYFPLPLSADAQLRGYEAPLFESLKGPELPREFPLTSRPFHFAARDDRVEQVLVAAVPFEAIELEIDETNQRYSAHLSILALIKNTEEEIVYKKSQDYPLQGSVTELEDLKESDVLLLDGVGLSPGRYHLEVAAYDHLAGKSSARRQVLVVSEPSVGVSISSLILIGGVEPLSATEQLLYSPLKHGDHKVIPRLESTIDPAEEPELAFYCTVYPSGEASSAAGLTVGMYKDGQLVFRGMPELKEAGVDGKLAGMFTIPTEGLSAGTYQLRAWARQGDSVASESVLFTVSTDQ